METNKIDKEYLEQDSQYSFPYHFLVENKNVTLEGIQQFKVVINEEWKYDTLIDIYNLVNISQCIIYINYKNKLMNVYDELIREQESVKYLWDVYDLHKPQFYRFVVHNIQLAQKVYQHCLH